MRSLLGRFHRPMSRGLVNNMLTMNNLGDGSTLSLDFTAMGGVLDPRLTFTRASTVATYINSSGYVATATTNEPRFDYSPTNIGEPRGLLVEGVGINLTTYSEDFANAVWTKDNSVGSTIAVVTTVSAATPANGTTVNQIVFSRIVGGFSRVTRTSVGTASTPYTMSVWMRTVSGTANVGLRIGGDILGFKCEVTTTWKRFKYTFTLNSTSSDAQIMLWENIVGTDLTATVYAWGCQVEAGSGASSYIPTGASQVTRTVDTCYMSGISSWYNESAGTVISNITYDGLATDNSGIELSVGTGSSATNRIGIRKGYVDYYSGGVNSAEMYPTVTSGNVRIGTAYSLNDFAMCSNGGTMRTDGSGAVPVGLNTLKLYADNGTSGLVINGLIKSIKYFPTRLSNAQLQTLTTP